MPRKVVVDFECPECGNSTTVIVNEGQAVAAGPPTDMHYLVDGVQCGGLFCDVWIGVFDLSDGTVIILEEEDA
jgi:hypothetical protein